MPVRPFIRKLLLVLPVGLVVGCTKPPAMPRLPHREPLPIERTVLHETLTASDVRNLFRAVNVDGKLDALKPYLETPSDATLGELGDLATRYLYDDAQSETGVLALVKKRAEAKAFTALHETAAREAGNPEFPLIREALWRLVGLDDFPELVKRDLPLIEPDVVRIARAVWSSGKSEYRESKEHGEIEPLSLDELVADLDRFLSDEGRRAGLETFLRGLGAHDFATAALKALADARKDRGMEPFEGLGHGVHRLFTSGRELEKLLALARALDAPSAGLFAEAQRKIVTDNLGDQLAIFLRPNIAGGIVGLVGEATAKLPFKTYGERFIAIRTGIEQVTGPAHPDTATDYLIFNLPIYLHTYALEKWMMAMGALPENKALWDRITQPNGFTAEAWATEIKVPSVDVNLVRQQGGNFALDDKAKNDLKGLGLDRFADLLDDAVKGEGNGDFHYTFMPVQPRKSLREAFADAVRACDTVRPFAEPSSYVRLLLFRLTRKDQGSPLVLEQFETENLMDSLGHLLTFVGRGEWPTLKRFLFDDVKIGRLDGESRRILMSLYDDAALKRKVETVLDNVQTLYELDRDVRGLPSPFDIFLRLLEALPRADKHAATMLASYAADSGLLARDADRPAYPGAWRLLGRGPSLARLTYAASAVAPADRARVVSVGQQLLSQDGLTRHLDVVAKLAHEDGAGLAAALRRLVEGDDTLSIPDLSDAERAWIQRFVRNGDLARLVAFFKSHGSRRDVAALTEQLERLSRSGYLRDALNLLEQVHNERVQAIARTARAWDQSGELRQLLAAIRILTRP